MTSSPDTAPRNRNPGHASALADLVRADPWIMSLLRAAGTLDLREWCLAAGVIRNRVWDHLHGYRERTVPADIDLLFYDKLRTDAAYQAELERRLSLLVPSVRWEAVNQATVHTYTQDRPYVSIEDAMSRWVDPVTAVGVWLIAGDQIVVVAPLGLDDLFGLTVRPHLVTPNAAAVYRQRMVAKRWTERWPRLTIIWPES
jgi:hypothetical protein